MRQQLGRQRGGQRDARLDARIRQVHREDELLPNRAHAIRRTQSGAQSDVITHLQVEHPVAVHVTEGPDLTKLGHAEPRLLEH